MGRQHLDAVAGQSQRRLDQARPGKAPMGPPERVETGKDPRNAT
jgi:hypothetical protein